MSLRTFATLSAGTPANVPLALTWAAISPVIDARAGTTLSFHACVRTYSDSVARESAGVGPIAYLLRDCCVVVAIATKGVICSTGIARFSA